MAEGRSRPAWVEIDLAAVRHNVAVLRRTVAPAALCAVVKAGGYGHGAVAVARAALDAGASGVAVALVEEGVELREAGITEPVLILSEPPLEAAGTVVSASLTPTVASHPVAAALADAAGRVGVRLPVHVKVDTGMHRVGVAPDVAPALVARVAAHPSLHLEGVFTHLAVADGVSDADRAFTAAQLEAFDGVLGALTVRAPVRHAANTAAAVSWPASRYDMVRCGIGVYGLPPSAALEGPSAPDAAEVLAELRPALSLRARVTAVRHLAAGSRPSYGRLRPLERAATVATVPLGYADGVPRALFGAGYAVLVGGRRRPLAGMVTMDQLVVDCGDDPVEVGDDVTLIGRQGDEEITAVDWAAMLGTIDYEVVCAIGGRVPRRYLGEGAGGWRR